MEKKYCNVQFKYISNINESDQVKIVGGIDSLGNWDINKSEKLFYDEKEYIWKSRDDILLPQNTNIEYKYVIFKNKDSFLWEELPNNKNRVINVENRIKLIIMDKENDLNGIIEKSDSLSHSIDTDNKGDINSNKNKEIDENDEFKDLNYESNTEDDDENVRRNSFHGNEYNEDEDYVIMVSLYLPFNGVKINEHFEIQITNDPLYHTLHKLIANSKNVKWFGTIKNQNLLSENEKKEISEKLKQKNMYLLDYDIELFKKIQILFTAIFEPVFHYQSFSPEFLDDISKFDIYWEALLTLSDKICDTIIPYLNSHTLIYLHDYPMFLVPSILYSKCSKNCSHEIFQNLSIGLFIHTPFPSYENFKKLPCREEILKSLMNCSVIGFHTYDYSGNFLKTSKRLLSINYESTLSGDIAINYFGRTSMIRVEKVTPEIDYIKEDSSSEEFKKFYDDIKKKYPEKSIFVSLDDMKMLSSIKTKMEGYKKFLDDLGDNISKCVYLLYIRISTDELDKDGKIFQVDESQKEMLEKIDELCKEIKEEYGEDVIDVIKGKLSYEERLAVFASSNCLVRTSKQESYSLGVYEYLILKKLFKQENNFSYMLSELSGLTTSLESSVKINPYDYDSVYKGFIQAYQDIYGEKDEKDKLIIDKDFQHVMKSSCKEWLNSFLKDIKNTKLSDENTFYMGVGEGLNFKLMKINSDFQQLDSKTIIPLYNKSNHRLIFLDYEGTLPSNTPAVSEKKTAKGYKPKEEILSILNKLTSDKKNIIYIITGRGTKLLNNWFGSVKNLGIAAEHGSLYKINSGNSKEKWNKIKEDYNNEWINRCADLLEPYTERCEGALLEIKECSIVWQYSDCDQELGKAFASAITNELEKFVKKLNLKVVNGKGYVEIIALGIHKGYFVSYIVKKNFKEKNIPDFIMCIGDDTTDEKMFHYLKSKGNYIKNLSKDVNLISVIVGKKPSEAKYYVNGPNDIEDFLNDILKESK